MPTETGHILVVDDDRVNRMMLSRILHQQGHTVALAETGVRALEMLRTETFDVMLLDIMMPEMDGYQTLERMKRDSALRDIPVIVISALDEEDERAIQCIEIGAEDYLTKPIKPVILAARLRASLDKKRLRDLEVAYLKQEATLRQNEQLAKIGKLSAGMAHELNNPAAAAMRGASQLRAAVAALQRADLQLGELGLSSLQRATLLAHDQVIQDRAAQPIEIDPITRGDHEEEIEDWLEERGVADAWEAAPALVRIQYGADDLAALTNDITADQLPAVIDWLGSAYAVYSLLAEIAHGTGRIAELVKALKSYSYLDQAPIQSVDVREGLDDTLVMLRGKTKDGITLHREYADDLPRIQAHGSELNQVWTNIIDNAVDAMDGRGEITIRARQDGADVLVEIEDTGPGIPESVQATIFDPFVTTKPPGEGTGMGMYLGHNIVVGKHKGAIHFSSQPGQTRFVVRLPIEALGVRR